MRIIGLRNIYTVKLPTGHGRPHYAKCYTNSNFNSMLLIYSPYCNNNLHLIL